MEVGLPVLKELEIKQKIALGKKAEYNDSSNLYLAATVAKTGYWQVNRTVGGKRLRCQIGRYPHLSSKDARRLAPQIYDLLEVADPKHLKELCKITSDPDRIRQFVQGDAPAVQKVAPSFESYARQWWETNIKPSTLDPKTIRQKIQQLEDYAFPVIGSKPINTITFEEIRQLLLPMWTRKGERGGNKAGNETASRLLGIMREIYRVALNDRANTKVEYNPTPTKKDFAKFEAKTDHQPSLDYKVAPEFWNWLMEESGASTMTKIATATVFLLGKRSGEVRHLKWAYVDLDAALIHAPGKHFDPKYGREKNYTKNGEPHTTPIPNKLLEMLKEAKELTSGNEYALSLRPTKPMSENTVGKLLKGFQWRDPNGKPATTHGARRTVGEWIEAEFNPQGPIRKMVLQQKLDPLEKAYAVSPELRVPFEKQRRDMMQRWEDYVTGG